MEAVVRHQVLRGRKSAVLLLVAMVAALVVPVVRDATPAAAHNGAPGYVDGSDSACEQWTLAFLALPLLNYDIAEEGWAWVDPSRKLRDASGVVTGSQIAYNDTPANHYSHDWNADIRVDPGQKYLLSDINHGEEGSTVPSLIEMEWETGITPSQTDGDGAGWIPSWARPSIGDRIWVNGHWIFDCGHGTEVVTPMPTPGDPSSCPEGTSVVLTISGPTDFCFDRHYRSEIHPARAIASMRSQAAPVPGSGTTPVPVTATDLFIRGRGGFVVQQLNCGVGILLSGDPCPTTTTPIDDLYSFDICVPPEPEPLGQAVLTSSVSDGPDNDLSTPVRLDEITITDADDPCAASVDEFGNDFDDHTKLRATVDLQGSGAQPDDVLARRIVSGWVSPPEEPLHHVAVTLQQMNLHDDHEIAGDGELSVFFMNVNRSPADEWHRLSDWDVEDPGDACTSSYHGMESYDDDDEFGDGLMDFCGPSSDFYLRPGQDFTVRTTAFEQDCYDHDFDWGSGDFSLLEYAGCYTVDATGNNDKVAKLEAAYDVDDVGTRPNPVAGVLCFPGDVHFCTEGEFSVKLAIDEVALGDEDTSDLDVSKSCGWNGEVPLVGRPFRCTITIDNPGPGLPRDVTLTDAVTSGLGSPGFTVAAPTATVTTPTSSGPVVSSVPCSLGTPSSFSCEVGTVPVGGHATAVVDITPLAAGVIDDVASVTTESTDPDTTNNEAAASVDVFRPITIDVGPGQTIATVNPARKGVVPVAVVNNGLIDVRTLDVDSLCFGDAGTPGERDCTEEDGIGRLEDIDRDRDLDLLLHFATLESGIDRGDTSACLKGRDLNGIGVYGCDTIITV